MPTNSFAFPASGLGFARDACLTKFGSSVPATSGIGYLGTGTYQVGNIYVANPTEILPISGNLSPFNPTAPAPVIFGDWVFYVLNGQLPTQQPTGGVSFINGAYGGVEWTTSLAYTGSHALEVSGSFGGVLAFDSALPSVFFQVVGNEVFSVQYQVLDNLPSQIEIQFYEATGAAWHTVYVGPDNFGLGGTNVSATVAPVLNSWVAITFTPAQMGLTPGDIITGMAWGIYNATGTTTAVFSDTANLNAPATPLTGFIDAAPDNNVGFFILSHTGPLYQVPAIGAPAVPIPLATSPSFVYTGLTSNPSDGLPYFIGYDGTIYKYNSSVSTVTVAPSGIAIPARGLYADSSNHLYTIFPTSNKTGTYSIIGNNWVFIASPFNATLDTLYYSLDNNQLLIAGSNFQQIDIVPTIIDTTYASTPNQLLLADNTPEIQVFDFTDGDWQFNQVVAGYTGVPTQMAAEPDGMQVLVTDSTNNQVEVLTFVAGVWNQTSTVPLTAPTSIVTYTSGIVQAAICQPTQNLLSFLNKSGLSWALAQTLPVTGPTDIAVQKTVTALNGIVSNSTGVSFLHFNGAVWVDQSSLTLSPVPTLVATDSIATTNTLFYAAAQSGSDIVVYIFQNQTLVGQYTITGEILSTFAVVDYEILVGAQNGNLYAGYYINGTTGNTIASTAIPTSGVSMNWIATVTDFLPFLSVAGPHSLWSLYNDSPQSYTRFTDSNIAVLSGVSWNSISLQDHNHVSSITTDTSGNIYAVTTDNDIYKYSSLGVLASGYPYTVLPPQGQEENIPLGLSKLVWYNGQLVSASSLMGGLTFITT